MLYAMARAQAIRNGVTAADRYFAYKTLDTLTELGKAIDVWKQWVYIDPEATRHEILMRLYRNHRELFERLTHADKLRLFERAHGYVPGTVPGRPEFLPLTEQEMRNVPWCSECCDWHEANSEHSSVEFPSAVL